MFTGGRSSYVLATVLTLALHIGLVALLIKYHDQLDAVQLYKPQPIKLTLVDNNFNPLAIQPVQSRLIIEKAAPPPKAKPKPQTKAKAKKAKKPLKATPKKAKSVEPTPTKENKQQKTDPLESKIQDIKQQPPKTVEHTTAQSAVPDTPEARIAKRYVARMRKQIEKNWTKPLNVQYQEMAGLKVLIRLTLAPDGQLRNAQIIQSSGNSQFDRSALNAVLKTREFQVPDDADIFNTFFRQVTISYNL